MKLPLYLDNHSTTRVDPRVAEAMAPYLTVDYGNAASRQHAFGWRAEAAVEKARAQVASLIGASSKEIIFTSGATESNNLALKGALEFNRHRGDHLLTVATEHKSVLDVGQRLSRQHQDEVAQLRRLRLIELCGEPVSDAQAPELLVRHPLEGDRVLALWMASSRLGARVEVLPVQPDGRLDLGALERALTSATVVVSVMLANNEVGVIQPVEEIGRLCRERGVLFHTDAAQGVGKIPFGVEEAQADLVSLSAHKLYGPKGVGALYVRRKPRVRVAAQIDGGGHEWGMRSGTLAVPNIVGFGEACELAQREREEESARILRLRERLREGLCRELEGVRVNGSLLHRLPGNLNLCFEQVDGEALMLATREVAVSSGSACSSASLEPSYVLRALGLDEQSAQSSLRFGVGRFNTEEEIDHTVRLYQAKVRQLRALHPRVG